MPANTPSSFEVTPGDGDFRADAGAVPDLPNGEGGDFGSPETRPEARFNQTAIAEFPAADREEDASFIVRCEGNACSHALVNNADPGGRSPTGSAVEWASERGIPWLQNYCAAVLP